MSVGHKLQIIHKEQMLGRVLAMVRLDQVPNLNTRGFEEQCHAIDVLVRWGGRNRHESVAAASVRHDIVERRAEASLARAREGGSPQGARG